MTQSYEQDQRLPAAMAHEGQRDAPGSSVRRRDEGEGGEVKRVRTGDEGVYGSDQQGGEGRVITVGTNFFRINVDNR